MALPFMNCSCGRLDEIVRHRLLCVFDFDGTLAPTATRADDARVPMGIQLRLAELSSYAPIAVISGRPLADLQGRLGFDPEFVIGNEGLEGAPENERSVFNFLPARAADKRTTLERLMRTSGATSAIYIGADATDEAIFRMRRPDLLTIRLGLEPHTAAEFFLPHRLDIWHALDGLIRRMRQAQMQNWMHVAPAGSKHERLCHAL